MKQWIGVLICLILICPIFAMADEKEEVSETVTTEVEEPELPPAIQEILDKEMEKLPPVEQHFRKAQQLHARGKLEEAIEELELSLKKDPQYVPSNCELGVIYMGQDDYDKAIEQLKKTLELDPEYPKTHYALANAYARKPQPDVKLARKHLDEAIRLGYHPVPWFLEYMRKLEAKESSLPETSEAEDAAIIKE